MQERCIKIYCLLFFFLGFFLSAQATHIVGGEVTYECLGGNYYRIRVDVYQDCLAGHPSAIKDDNPAYIAIYDMAKSSAPYISDSIYMGTPLVVPVNFNNSCITNPPNTCLRKVSFIKEYVLPDNGAGYLIVYQRCCRNGSIYNIINPSEIGATYYCQVPPVNTAPCNNSAVFTNYPPQIICVNNPLVYDHGATDKDGDSLSYEFCNAYLGGSTADVKPLPPKATFNPVLYRSPFTATSPMGGNPPLKINPTTGVITGTPNLLGRYVVTVCCTEWRNGKAINKITREFQFVVTNCSKAVIANIPQYSDEFNTYIVKCDNYTVKFDNWSVGGFAYHWDFGVPGTDLDTSAEFEPTFVYPDSGTYVVSLIVNKGTTCPDSISRFVKVYPTLSANIGFKTPVCPNDTVQFTDLTSSTYQVNSWVWKFDDASPYATVKNPAHVYRNGGLYNVALVAQNAKGCFDTAYGKITVDPFYPDAGDDTVIVRGEKIYFNATGGFLYQWTPGSYLNNPNIANPVGTYTDTGTFQYSVFVTSMSGCKGYDTLTVKVIDGAYLVVPNAFTPNGDGLNDYLRPIGVGFQHINSFRIFNRWGQQVFYTHTFEDGWDGNFNGRQADIGVYYWSLSIRDRFGNDQELKGDVTLLR